MSASANHKLRFSSNNREFAATLNKRVNDYFRINNVSKQANGEMIIKTIFMFLLYLVPYALVVTEVVTGPWMLVGMVFLMALGLSGIGLSVMHDANHGAYSKKKWLNNTIGYSLDFIGANAFNWKMQHNVLHHTFTNVHEHD